MFVILAGTPCMQIPPKQGWQRTYYINRVGWDPGINLSVFSHELFRTVKEKEKNEAYIPFFSFLNLFSIMNLKVN